MNARGKPKRAGGERDRTVRRNVVVYRSTAVGNRVGLGLRPGVQRVRVLRMRHWTGAHIAVSGATEWAAPTQMRFLVL